MHVPLRRDEIGVPRELLDRGGRRAPHGEVRAERVSQQVNAVANAGASSGSSHQALDFPLGERLPLR